MKVNKTAADQQLISVVIVFVRFTSLKDIKKINQSKQKFLKSFIAQHNTVRLSKCVRFTGTSVL